MEEGNFVSEVISGYSVDNLSPSAPVELSADLVDEYIYLSWTDNTELDLGYYNIYRNGELLTSVLSSEHEDETVVMSQDYEYSLTAVDIHGNESSFADAVNIFTFLSGDINFDATVNVQDIVVMVNIIILPEEEYSDETLVAADINGDGIINVLDIVLVLNIIFPDDMARLASADEDTLYYGSNTVSYKANGAVGGFQLEVAGEYEITSSVLPEGWEMHYNEGIVVIFSMDGSSLESNTLFEYAGNMTIESIIVSDIEGNAIPASSVIVPATYTLESAYPNPFNPVTALSLALPVTSNVSLYMYDINGRIIDELINGSMDCGYHSVDWNADSCSSGVYFVKMVAGEYVNTQKLMLIK